MTVTVRAPRYATNREIERIVKEKEPWIRELVTVLMYYEILTRRKRKNQQWQIGTMGNRYYF